MLLRRALQEEGSSCTVALSLLAFALPLNVPHPAGRRDAPPEEPIPAATIGPTQPLTPCLIVAPDEIRDARCPRHEGPHLLTRAGASVALLPSGLVHVVEACGPADHESDEEGDDPYVLWYTMAAPAGPTQPCPNPAPYASLPYGPNVPNPNTPDPNGVQATVTRHWAAQPITYSVNFPGGQQFSGGNNIFAGTGLLAYTWDQFKADVQIIMGITAGIATANIQTPIYGGDTATNYDTTPLAPATQVILTSGQLIWTGDGSGGSCGGPTGDGNNEFIFLQLRSLGGVQGGLTSMLVNPATGTIAECDVVYEVSLNPSAAWGNPTGLNNGLPFSSGLAHEIGHFFGLDHTNVHPGGQVIQPGPATGFPATFGMAYTSRTSIPSMTGGYVNGDTVSRVTNPWRTDDETALSVLYPVPGLTAAKSPLIDNTATGRGRVISVDPQYDDPAGIFSVNVYVIERPDGQAYGTQAPPGVPPVGTPSGIARLLITSVIGGGDTVTGAAPTGEFQLEGIPATSGGPTEYDFFFEPMECISVFNRTFASWWYEATLNPTLNVYAPANRQIALTSNSGPGTPPPGLPPALPLGSLAMMPGTIIDLPPIDVFPPATPVTLVDAVSRPVIDIQPRTFPPPAAGTLIPVTIHHNRTAYTGVPPPLGPLPLQSVTFTYNGNPMRAQFSSSGPAPGGWFVTVYNAQIPTPAAPLATIEVTALEIAAAPGTAPSVVGRSRVRY